MSPKKKQKRPAAPTPGAAPTKKKAAGSVFFAPGAEAVGTKPVLPPRGPALPPPAKARPKPKQSPKPTVDPVERLFALPVDESMPGASGCAPAFLDDAPPAGLAATYRYRAPDTGGHYDLAVRFVGMRRPVPGQGTGRDRFERIERLAALPANGEDVALTTRVTNVLPGEWRIVAEPVEAPPGLPRRIVETTTRFAQLAQGPRVRPWSWPVLVFLGAVVALVTQAVLAAQLDLGWLRLSLLSVVASLLGFVGGKLWYLALHRKPLREFLSAGAGIQGFLLVSLLILAGGSALSGLSVGDVLDVTAPGIFLGVAVGRPGCFFTGCCAGRPTASSWGLVSSDRRVVVRRVPVQILEAGSGLLIGVAALWVLLAARPPLAGTLFVASLAAYTLVRQLLFPLRVESHTRRGRTITLLVSALLLLVAVSSYFV